MAVVEVENKTYTADPLYQWDQNQVLEIRGLGLARVPEVHFTNTLMDRAVVRPASMDAAGVITTQVPNSLLQKASRITVYLCDYEGDAFKTLYKIEIPVRARPMPGDYTFEDDAGEIYSFNALETQVVNALAAAEAAATAYTSAAQIETAAAQDLVEAKAAMDAATASQADAAQKYAAALETLGGVQDGTVYIKRAGDAMAGPLDMSTNAVKNLPEPVDAGDAASKSYVDALGVKLVTLWENEGLAEAGRVYSIGEKDVPLDLSRFGVVHIRWLLVSSSNNARYFDGVYSVGGEDVLNERRQLSPSRYAERNFTVKFGGVHFNQGTEWALTVEDGVFYGANTPTSSAIIPVRISGLAVGRDNE